MMLAVVVIISTRRRTAYIAPLTVLLPDYAHILFFILFLYEDGQFSLSFLFAHHHQAVRWIIKAFPPPSRGERKNSNQILIGVFLRVRSFFPFLSSFFMSRPPMSN